VDDHIWMALSGLRADGRVLADRAVAECQEYRLRCNFTKIANNKDFVKLLSYLINQIKNKI
jgi:20S proteasome alpha/beta subunit